ncbi:MAG TPA: chitobiase/beta-hexosaminidase C-terminal domain-containing protein [Terracidiphilus sp.]|jgi:hypothetical protein
MSLLAQTPTPVPVLTWRYDLTHAGQNTDETALTPANVNVNSFGKLFSMQVDSTVYAQPLYVPGLTMSDGQVHNVVFVATENDSIYAFDADSNGGANSNPIWHITLLDAAHGASSGATAVPADPEGISPQGDIGPTIGITGTPAINAATNTMYVVGNTYEQGTYFSRLHAINILTGAEQSSSPVNITATITGTGTGSSGGQLSFDPLIENQRPALDYYNGYVYIGYAAHGDIGPWHGWLFAYNATTLAQSTALCLSPNGDGGGIWGSGAGLPIDDDASGGRMFVVTGNGTNTTYPPFSAQSELGESVLDINLSNGGLTPTDAFTSFNYEILNSHDWDQGSGGILMVPDQQGAYPHILLTSGKEGRVTVLNRDNLGGYLAGASSNTNALQDISPYIPPSNGPTTVPGQLTQAQGLWSTPAYWNGNVYIWAEDNSPMLFKLNNGVMDTTPSSQGSITSNFPGPSFSISSNGTQDGIAWAVRADQYVTYGQAVLYAWDANDLTAPIYESDTNSTRDSPGIATKFSIPVVTNGKVYVVAHNAVVVYGLFNGEPNAAAPVITPDGGTFGSSQSVTLSTTTASANIYYTLDGSTPTPASTLYAGPIAISADTTINAMASAPGYVQSGVSSATFTLSDQTPLLSFSPAAGTYLNAQQVTIADPDANAKIYYTTDGSTPSASSTLYSGPISVGVSETINAIAIDPSLANSDVGTAAYVIQNGGSSINFANGFSNAAGLTFNGSAVASNDSRLQLTDGGLNEAGSVFWNAPIDIQAFTTTFTFQLSNAQGNGFTFTIQNNAPTALGGDSAGLGYQNIQNSVAVKFNFYNYENEGGDSTGFYTDGEPPVLPTIDLTPSGIELNSDDGMTATLTYDGTTLTLKLVDGVTGDTFTTSQAINIPQVVGGNTAYVGFTGGTGGLSASQKITSWTYSTQAVPPAFSPAAGTYSAAQNVALSSATPDAVIYYATDGSTPTAASTAYSAAIAVAASETINAVAISPTMGTSNAETAAYVINASSPPPPAGAFTLSGTPVSIASPGSNATSTITVTPSGGFTGTVALACAVTASPAGAVDTPTCSVSQPPAISGAAAATATLTVNTMAGAAAALHNPFRAMFGLSGGASLAAVLFLCLPFRRRRWQALFSLLILAVLATAATGCVSSKSTTPPPTTGGTTAGSYIITVTGTSGSTNATTTIAVTVE